MNAALYPYKYIPYTFRLSKENNTGVDVGLDMLINNVNDIEKYKAGQDDDWYHGADELDYQDIHDSTKGLGLTEICIRKNVFHAVRRANAKKYQALYQAGKDDECISEFVQDVIAYLGTEDGQEFYGNRDVTDIINAITTAAVAEGIIKR